MNETELRSIIAQAIAFQRENRQLTMVLAALAHKNGGELRITKADRDAVASRPLTLRDALEGEGTDAECYVLRLHDGHLQPDEEVA
jgi:hypothetical protein